MKKLILGIFLSANFILLHPYMVSKAAGVCEKLERDPFSRSRQYKISAPSPKLENTAEKRKPSDGPLPAGPPPAEAISAAGFKLTATLVADDDNSMANINGTSLRIGEIIKGYKLIAVDEGEATLEKNGKTVTIFIKKKTEKSAENN